MQDLTMFEKHTEIFSSDLGMYYCGQRIKTKNHQYGPEIRSHFLIVLIESGKAVLYQDDKEIYFKDKDILIMFPGEKIHYKALTDWTIKWIGVGGSQVETIFSIMGVTPKMPIITSSEYDNLSLTVSRLYETATDNSMYVKCKIQSLLYSFFSYLLQDNQADSSSDIIDSALKIIKYNYNNEINIKKIADSFHLDSAYFSRLFKSRVGKSPKKVIMEERIEKAKEMLISSDHPIKEISNTVGFNDQLYFSKLFYKYEGLSPTEFRKKARQIKFF